MTGQGEAASHFIMSNSPHKSHHGENWQNSYSKKPRRMTNFDFIQLVLYNSGYITGFVQLNFIQLVLYKCSTSHGLLAHVTPRLLHSNLGCTCSSAALAFYSNSLFLI